ncbi:NAD(+) diphosphatase [Marinimicrococcus flavescens]|uniref:NAD(+) diphosphatase n=1 Tax=Marinimicrococcus flavescens TaxID=3031815 RepID=A0AAP3XPQ3_9PROT|nr:NAD(+) diphosphatase [Marinimicrococcus flavescens]
MLRPPSPPHVYSGAAFDRAALRRRDAAWLEACRRDPQTRIVFLSGLAVPVDGPEEAPRLRALRLGEIAAELPDEAVFLGIHEGAPHFAVDLPPPPSLRRFVELRSVGLLLPTAEAGLLALARALRHWHEGHRFCGACGAPTRAVEAGHARRCDPCERTVFPRTDPAVIVLVTRGEHCVLGRAGRFPEGMYSTLAGFVEPGETLEECLAREVMEEVGILVERPVYRSSQPWPFPQSLMLGFRAEARSEAIRIDPEEIEDARWFSRAELAQPARRPVRLPSEDSIARFLIEEWLAEG